MITEKYTKGFTISKDKLAVASQDVEFESLIQDKSQSDDALSRKSGKLMHDFCTIVCAKLEESVQLKVHPKTHTVRYPV
jgi:hypothetical protein